MSESKQPASSDDLHMMDYLLEALQPTLISKRKESIASFQKYFFRVKPHFALQDIERLLRGDVGKKGLLFACGQEGMFSLRKSAVRALKLLWMLLDPEKNEDAKLYRFVMLSSDKETLNNMKLEKHESASDIDASHIAHEIQLLIRNKQKELGLDL